MCDIYLQITYESVGFFKTMYDKTIIDLVFRITGVEKVLIRSYKPPPSATVDNANETKRALIENVIIPNITNSESNNCLIRLHLSQCLEELRYFNFVPVWFA